MDQRRLLGLSGRLYSSPISDFWQVSTTDQDPSVPNLPLETAESGAPVDQPQGSDWDWDEQLPTDLFILGYQNSDATPVLSQVFSDGWNWEESLDDEWPTDQQLQPVVIVPDQPQDTVWDWDEVLSPEIISGGYQQADNAPAIDPIQHTDGGWDWSEPIADEWAADQVISVTAAVSPIQYSNHEWDWDEVLSPEIVVNGYQQADNTPAPSPDQVFDTGWEFEAVSDEDGWSNHFTNYDPIATQLVGDAWDWDDQVSDDWLVDQVTVANAEVITDPVQHTTAEWDWDEVLYPDLIVSGYQQSDNAITPNTEQQAQTDWAFDADFGGEDGWNNHFTNYELPGFVREDAYQWDEFAEDEWWVNQPQIASVAPIVNPIQHTSAEWDFDEYAEYEWHIDGSGPVVADYVPVPDVTDTHDGFWRKQYQKMFAHKPKLAEVVEIIQQNPKEAVAAVREIEEVRRVVYERYPDIDYSQVINDARIALFIAQNLLNAIELQRIQDEEDDLLIMLLLSL